MAKILIVEDEVLVRKVAIRIVELKGHEVESAMNGAVALEMVRHTHFDVVITDRSMPVMDGTEFYRQTVQECPKQVRAWIFTTGFGAAGDDAFIDMAEQTGWPLVAKPYNPKQLQKIVEEVLTREC